MYPAAYQFKPALNLSDFAHTHEMEGNIFIELEAVRRFVYMN